MIQRTLKEELRLTKIYEVNLELFKTNQLVIKQQK